MDTLEKLELLADAAKYDAACTSSGVDRAGKRGALGAASGAGCCHAFSADGRCITLLKVLLTNVCCYDCAYCVNRRSNDVPRAAFTPRELADLTIGFYRRNCIEGLFLSSGVLQSPDYTMELIIETARILREEEGFRGYIHAKAIPGASPELVARLGRLADRMSVNVELPSQRSLDLLAPDKASTSVVRPMRLISEGIAQGAEDRRLAKRQGLRHQPERFAPAGQATQLIIGATPETDQHILRLAEGLYDTFHLKRVFFSAYAPVNDDVRLPGAQVEVPLTREHRLYQADWLLRYYGFRVDELLTPQAPDLDLTLDPKAAWALRHMELFPLEVNRASYEELLRVPGVGVKTARRIVRARRRGRLGLDALSTLGLSLKRAGFFITCAGKMAPGFDADPERARRAMRDATRASGAGRKSERGAVEGQLALFSPGAASARDPFAAPGHRDRLLEAARGRGLVATDPGRVALGERSEGATAALLGATPSGLPAADPLAGRLSGRVRT